MSIHLTENESNTIRLKSIKERENGNHENLGSLVNEVLSKREKTKELENFLQSFNYKLK